MKRTGLSDTSPEAERVLAAAYRAMSPARKWALLGDMYRYGRRLHADGVRIRRPGATEAEVRGEWMAAHLGTLPPRPTREESDIMDQPIENQGVVQHVIAAFDALGIAYALGGSLASSIHGYTRLTTDADITAEPFPGKEDQLASQFGPDYYVSPEAIRQANRDRSTFNIINTSIGFKVDVFIRKDRPFERSLMDRRIQFTSADAPDRPVSVVSAEDIILLKLEWYRLGGEISERQWSDVLGVLRTQADRLDGAYLDQWASSLGVADLMEQARREAGP